MDNLDWPRIQQALDDDGWAQLPVMLDASECDALIRTWDGANFRSTVDMARFRFGQGEYRYYAYPLPPRIAALRQAFYPPLAETANRWALQRGRPATWPAALDDYLAHCHAHGQTRPTPLILRYETGGYNCLHQDVYGDLGFPLQVVIVLSERGVDYEGGELLLMEQRPRAQSIGHVITPPRGGGLIFPNRLRPVRGSRGFYAANVRHGVSRLRSGIRFSLGLIFHDAT